MTTIEFPIQIITPNRIYDPVGKCIYCPDPKGKLTDEHVVPFGLAADSVVLPLSSCQKCAKITGKIEQHCLRGMFGNFRIAIGAPTRRPKERPKTISVRAGRLSDDRSRVDDIKTLEIDPTDIIMLPSFTFPAAGILEGRDPAADIEYRVNIHRMDDRAIEFCRQHGAIESTLINPMAFLRMAAKIAHSYAVAELGLGSFRPFLLDLILCRTQELNVGLRWIGCEPAAPPPAADLFSLSYNKFILASGERFVIVHLRLFPFFNTPLYHVVVGEWQD
ncbi:hypothetical protein [Bradyrhizobium sp. JYMT SZCCT0180]|uniref:hypothetical protein n=1 Tax=Bradyrhizobium sp. JYMT SZCCT0180 TaxID=2807666 RepID=UPI001BA5CBA8|nr:hypothetical protein [Bradyrhizobium sp. JYMT SZCCT0180]MBR1209016.1 hypothetical protein [Bradyrhizobium sp. JYMT SZCCT0180]